MYYVSRRYEKLRPCGCPYPAQEYLPIEPLKILAVFSASLKPFSDYLDHLT